MQEIYICIHLTNNIVYIPMDICENTNQNICENTNQTDDIPMVICENTTHNDVIPMDVCT